MNIVIGLSIAIIILVILGMYMNVSSSKKKKTSMISSGLTFTTDIEFLVFLIKHKILQCEKFTLEPIQAARSSLIDNDDAEKFMTKIIEDVSLSLSPHYKMTLYKYFTKVSLLEFITETVQYEFIKLCIRMNLSVYRDISNNENETTVISAKGFLEDDGDNITTTKVQGQFIPREEYQRQISNKGTR